LIDLNEDVHMRSGVAIGGVLEGKCIYVQELRIYRMRGGLREGKGSRLSEAGDETRAEMTVFRSRISGYGEEMIWRWAA
jgi:hypothetical protein